MTPRPGTRARRDERGYIAVTTGLILIVLMSFCAFAVDVGNWYLTGQRAQRAADAAALAGVTKLPGNQTGAFSMARSYSSNNGFTEGVRDTTVTTSLSGGPTRLRVDVTRTVDNIFGSLLGRPQTTISRYAVADFAGPVPLGSPCNRFGDDPDPNIVTSSANCDNTGLFWANVGSPAALKSYGDAFQNNTCSTEDGCSAGRNMDYDARGHVFTVTLRQPVNNLKLEAFDPAQIVVGDSCEKNSLAAADNLAAANTVVSNPATRYAPDASPWCTGDQNFGTGLIKTQFIIRSPGSNPWDPTTWPIVNTCTKLYEPYNADLSKVLDTRTSQYTARPDVATNFRQWVTLCDIPGLTLPGTYAIQVRTNGLSADTQGGHNRFGLRASGSSPADKDNISIAGFSKMVMYANTPNGRTRFFLGRIPSSSNGQIFNVNLFDIGDGATSGSTITVLPPTEVGGTFSGCKAKGVTNGNLTDCKISVSSVYNGKWQTISVPIPVSYTCNDGSPTGCWVRLEFYYGSGSLPLDTTSWQASVEGDPIRLVE